MINYYYDNDKYIVYEATTIFITIVFYHILYYINHDIIEF